MLSGARDAARIPTPLQANHSRFLASARTKVGPHTLLWSERVNNPLLLSAQSDLK